MSQFDESKDGVDYEMERLKKEIEKNNAEAEGEDDEYYEAEELEAEGDEDYEFMGFNNKGNHLSTHNPILKLLLI